MTKVKNVSKGPRYFHRQASGGTAVMLNPGQSWEGELDEVALKGLQSRNVEGKPAEFEIDGDVGGATIQEEDEFDVMSDEELRTYLTDRDGKAPAHNMRRDTMLERARNPE